jgi:hypothetical protein
MILETMCFAFSAIVLYLLVTKQTASDSNVTRYHTDGSYSAFDSASWAVTSDRLSPVLGGHKQSLYDDYITACDAAILKTKNRRDACTNNDKARIQMNKDQPSSVYNYTKDGYTKTRVPTDLYDLIKEYFDVNRNTDETEWKEYNVYHNAWEAPPTFIDMHREDDADGSGLTQKIEETIKPILEKWTGQRLSPVSRFLFGNP